MSHERKLPKKKGAAAKQVFLDISIAEKNVGKIVIELRDEIVPKTCENFRTLCTGDKGVSYKNAPFHRIVPNFVAQGGDFLKRDGSGVYSIYDSRPFEDENFTLKHSKAGMVSMANGGPNANGCQFFITLSKIPQLDGKHVVFGEVVGGMNVVKKIGEFGSPDGKPQAEVIIVDCGLYLKT